MSAASPEAGAAPFAGRRPDIDGLRAVAVTLVVLFHAGFAAVPGGFVGVDVFFVISGYLITVIARAEIVGGRFSAFAFYERRVRRIVPALVVVLVASGAAGLFVFLPEDLRLLAKSTLAAAVFVSNDFFARTAADYFAAENLTSQPLLHTWSLGVEAQFYLFYPLVLLAARRRPGMLPAMLAMLAALSLAIGIWGTVHRPIATFYLLPGRAWELLLGGLLTALPAPRRGWPADLAVGTGLVAIVLAALFDDPATPFPGVAALVPCAGAGLVILGGAGTLSRWLGAPPLAWLGRISYSLYLWHWPVLVLARYGAGRELPAATRAALVLATVALSALSYNLVERPFITRRLLPSRRRLLLGASVATAAALGLGRVLDLTGRGELPLVRLPPAVLALADDAFDRLEGECPVAGAGALPYPCRFGAAAAVPSVLLWGNSYARMWIPALADDAARHGAAGLAFLFSKCPPLLGDTRPDLPGCAAFNDAAIAYIETHPEIRTVVLGADWFVTGDALGRLPATVEAIEAAGKTVAILLAPPQADTPVPRALATAALRGEPPPPPLDEAVTRDRQRASRDAVARLVDGRRVIALDPFSVLCDGTACPLLRGGHAVFYDAGHLTIAAAAAIHGFFDPLFPAAQPR